MKLIDPYRYAASGFGGFCWEMDGISEFINVPDSNSLSFGDASNDSPFSLSAWVKMVDATNFPVVSKYTTSTAAEYYLYFDSSDRQTIRLLDNNTSNRRGRRDSAASTANEGSWIFVMMTYSGVGGASAYDGINLYKDNSVVDNTNVSAGSYTAMHNETADFTIGRYATTVFGEGRYADVYVWDSDMSIHASTIYNGGTPRNENIESLNASIVSSWTASDTANGVGGVVDQKGSNHGTLSGGMTTANVIADYP